MARMKVEFLHHFKSRHGYTLRDKLIAHLPDYAPYATKLYWLFNAHWLPGIAKVAEAATGISASRKLPKWRSDWFRTSKYRWDPQMDASCPFS